MFVTSGHLGYDSIQWSYVWQSILVFLYHLMIPIYNRENQDTHNYVSNFSLLGIWFMTVYNEVTAKIQC